VFSGGGGIVASTCEVIFEKLATTVGKTGVVTIGLHEIGGDEFGCVKSKSNRSFSGDGSVMGKSNDMAICIAIIKPGSKGWLSNKSEENCRDDYECN
jgi:hypothetical protein